VPTAISQLPARERPRERLLAFGVEALAATELLALLLREGRPGASALDLARALLVDFGGLQQLAKARPEELTACEGIGPAKASTICGVQAECADCHRGLK
jgi:DNA repair protein RadC